MSQDSVRARAMGEPDDTAETAEYWQDVARQNRRNWHAAREANSKALSREGDKQ